MSMMSRESGTSCPRTVITTAHVPDSGNRRRCGLHLLLLLLLLRNEHTVVSSFVVRQNHLVARDFSRLSTVRRPLVVADPHPSPPQCAYRENYSMESLDDLSSSATEQLMVVDSTLMAVAPETSVSTVSAASSESDAASSASALSSESLFSSPTLASSFADDDDDVSAAVDAILAASEEALAVAERTLQQQQQRTSPMAPPSDMSLSAVPTSADQRVEEPVHEDIFSTSALPPTAEGPPVHHTVSSSVVTTVTPKSSVTAPSVRKLLQFAIPAIGVWLCGPLLSLIDTSSVGLLSGTIEQAALNPAVAVTDYSALMIAFLFTASTNMMASCRESDRSTPGRPRTTAAFIGAMQLSTYVGTGLAVVLLVAARPLLRAIIGNDQLSPAVFAAAMKYVRIRALGMPAAAIIGTAQAACVGMQDIRSPLYVLAAAAVVNFIGDVLMVGSPHPWIGGAAGAAWATVVSQWVAVALFVRWLTTHPAGQRLGRASASAPPPASFSSSTRPHVNVSAAILELTGQPFSAGAGRRHRFLQSLRRRINHKMTVDTQQQLPVPPEDSVESVRGYLAGKFRARDLCAFPSREIRTAYAPYVLPVTSTQVGRVSGYVAMAHVVSSSLGTMSMAAQQVIVSLFYCLTPVADSLNLTAQSFVPALYEAPVSRARTDALRQLTRNLFKAGGVFGIFMVCAVACLPLLSRFFTADPVVRALVNSVTPLLVGFFAVHGLLLAAEGTLLGRRDLGFLGKVYSACFFVLPCFMLRVKHAALAGVPGINLTSVWKVFLAYQWFRWVVWTARVWYLERRTQQQMVDQMTAVTIRDVGGDALESTSTVAASNNDEITGERLVPASA